MKTQSLFLQYWSVYCFKTWAERQKYFCSLTKKEQEELIESFRKEMWMDLFLRNELDSAIDAIKQTHHIDLIDLRIQAIKHGKTFLIEQYVWDDIENKLWRYADYCDLNSLFGGLYVSSWGHDKQWYRIRGVKNKWR